MREEINYPGAKFTLVTESEEKTLVLYHANGRIFGVSINKQFDNEVDFKETVRSLKSKLQTLNDKIKELKNG